jgi:hypothetical protein
LTWISQARSLDRFGYGLDSPVTLSDPTGLRVPVDDRKGPDQGGSYDRRRPVMRSKSTGNTTRLRMPGDDYASIRGVYVRYAAASGSDTVTPYAMARMMFRNNNPWLSGEEFGRVEGLGAYDSCIAGEDGCAWRSVFLTWDTIRQGGIDEAAYQGALWQAPSDAEMLRGVSLGSAILATAAAFSPATVGATPFLAGLSAVSAVGAEAADPAPCKGQRILATAGYEMATGLIGGAISEAGSTIGGAVVDVGSEGWSPASQVTC